VTPPAPFPWTEIATALTVFGANVASPGPNVFNTIAIALGSGRRTALAVVPAVSLGVLAWAAAAVLGAAIVFRHAPWLATALTALGGALLVWFATRYARRAWSWTAESAGARAMTPRTAFVVTLGVLATNPKALTTWLVLVGIFPAGTATPSAVATMVLGAAALAGLIHAGYALAFSTRPAAAAYARAGRWITAAVAVFFGSLGVTLLARAAGALG
jgi:threonine/homoserine/homoserine lactone efflux protein